MKYWSSAGDLDVPRRSRPRSTGLMRLSRLPYTIVRPGWFDHHKPDEHRVVFLQGDRRVAGDSSDGVIARRQLAERGPAQPDLEPLFAALDADALDAVHGAANMTLQDEPQRVREDLHAVTKSAR